jgi:nanoRNase/pAp phosphatase (c-di-AMP/oligoRNAs hydrolase)
LQLIATHKNSDFDALASLVGASLLYPGAIQVLPTSVNQNVRSFLSIHKDLFEFQQLREIDLNAIYRLIVVDANRWNRLDGLSPSMLQADIEVDVWDHHPEIGDISPTWSRQDLVGSTTTLLVEAIQEKSIDFSPIHATLFLAGVYEDTGHLTFPSTTPRDLRAAACLLEKQADLKVIQSILRPTYGPLQKEVLFRMLSDSKRIKLNGFRVSVSRVDLDGHTPGLAEVVSMYRNIVNVDVAFGIFHDTRTERSMVIGRSGIDSVDVGAVMRILGGGGHAGAGSAMIKSAPPEGIEVWLMEAIKDHRQLPVQISDLMSFPVKSVSPDVTIKEVAAVLENEGYSGMPVMENERLVGIISRRDLNRVKPRQWQMPVKAFMSRDVISVTPKHSVAEAMRLLIKHDIGRLPVLHDDRVIGIISRSDAMIYYYDLIPE